MNQYCIVSADRLCHDTIMYIGTKQQCNNLCNPWYKHPQFGGIDAYIFKYDYFYQRLSKDKHFRS